MNKKGIIKHISCICRRKFDGSKGYLNQKMEYRCVSI